MDHEVIGTTMPVLAPYLATDSGDGNSGSRFSLGYINLGDD